MKLLLIVPATLVLVSLCGSPVPAPPGSISGFAYYDANRNGIHDRCDRPLANVRVVATAPDGSTKKAQTDTDGRFLIDQVPAGEQPVTLDASNIEFWPLTTMTSDGRPGALVSVSGLKDASGVEVGAASQTPISNKIISVSGVIFDDVNGNGQIDANECGIPGARASDSAGGGVFSVLNGDGTYLIQGLRSAGRVYPNLRGLWTPTTGPADQPCTDGVVPQASHGSQLYQANIGFKPSTTNGTLSGIVYDDFNRNGMRDQGETGIAELSVVLVATLRCGSVDNGAAALTDEAGHYQVSGLAPGVYEAMLGPGGASQGRTIYAIEKVTSIPTTVIIDGADMASLDLPVTVQQGSFVHAAVFDDGNRDGLRQDTEGSLPSVQLCLSSAQPGPSQHASSLPDACGLTDSSGLVQLGPLLRGVYRFRIGGVASSVPITTVSTVTITGSGDISVDVGLGLVPPNVAPSG